MVQNIMKNYNFVSQPNLYPHPIYIPTQSNYCEFVTNTGLSEKG